MPEPITWAALGVGAGTLAVVGSAGVIAGLRFLDQCLAIHRVATATATDFDFQLFERAVEQEQSFQQLTRQIQRIYENWSSCCRGQISIKCAKRRADRLRIALRRVLTEGLRLPPYGDPLLRGDPMPRSVHTPTNHRPREEVEALLADRQFRNSRFGRQLAAELQQEREMEEAARAQREAAQGDAAQAGAAAVSQRSASSQPSSQLRSDTMSQPSAVAQAATALVQAIRESEDQRIARHQDQAQREIDNRRLDVLAKEARRRAAGEDVPHSAVRPSEDFRREVRRSLRESGYMIHSSESGSPLSSELYTPLSSQAGALQTPTSVRSAPFAPAAGYTASGAGAGRIGGSREGDLGWTAPASAAATLPRVGLAQLGIPGQARKKNGDPGHIELQPLAQGPGPSGSAPQAQVTGPGIGQYTLQAQAAQRDAGGSAPQIQATQSDIGGNAPQAQAAQRDAGGSTPQTQATQPGTGRNAPQAQAAHSGTGQSATQTQPSMAGSLSFDSLVRRGSSSPRSSTSAVISKADETIRKSQEVLASVRRSTGSSPDLSVHGASSASPDTGTSQASPGTSSPSQQSAAADRAAHAAEKRGLSAGSTASATSASSQPTPRIGSPLRTPRGEAQAQASSSKGEPASSRPQEGTGKPVERRRAHRPSEPVPEDVFRRRILEKAAAEAVGAGGLLETGSQSGSSSPGGSSGRGAARGPLGLGGLSTFSSVSEPVEGESLPPRISAAQLLESGYSSGGAGSARSSRVGSRGRGDSSPRTKLAMAAAFPSSSSGSDAGSASPRRRRPGKEPRK